MKRSNSSMQLTRGADYATRVMLYLATLPTGERVLLPRLALATGAPESFLSKVLQSLSHAQLIASRRGQSGGFEILPRGRQASMREVIEAIEGPLSLNLCVIADQSCSREKVCPAHPVWERAQKALLEVLSSAVIEELALKPSASPEPPSGATPPIALKVLRS